MRNQKLLRAVIVCAAALFAIYFSPSLSYAAPAPQKSKVNPKSLALNEQGAQATIQKNFPLAEDLFKKALAEDAGNLTAVFNLAGIYVANNKEDEAISLLSDYTAKYKNDASLFARLGDAHFTKKNVALAEENYIKAMNMAPKYAGLHAKLATVYSLQNEPAKAETHLLKAVEEDPKNGQLLSNLAAVLLANNKPEQSISAAKRALQIKSSPELYITLGTAYESLKDYKNSLISYERARDLGSKAEALPDRIEAVKKLVS